jgi:glycosyltransferase involved in cell wall biosynthesis
MMQKPIVVANYVSASEQLENGHLGMIVPIDADALAKGIMRLCDDPALAEEYKKRLSERDFSNRSEIEKFYNIVK